MKSTKHLRDALRTFVWKVFPSSLRLLLYISNNSFLMINVLITMPYSSWSIQMSGRNIKGNNKARSDLQHDLQLLSLLNFITNLNYKLCQLFQHSSQISQWESNPQVLERILPTFGNICFQGELNPTPKLIRSYWKLSVLLSHRLTPTAKGRSADVTPSQEENFG